MKRNLRSPLFIVLLATAAILNQGCEDSSKSNELNQKIDALSKKLDTVLQNQTELQSKAEANAQLLAAQQQDALVGKLDKINYYYTTNLIHEIDLGIDSESRQLVGILTSQNDLKDSISGIEKQLKPRYGLSYETLGDNVNGIKEKVDRIEQSVNQIENDNRKIKDKLGIIF